MFYPEHEAEAKLLYLAKLVADHLKKRDNDEIITLINDGALYIALETICTQLFEYEVQVGHEVVDQVDAIAILLGARAGRFDRFLKK